MAGKVIDFFIEQGFRIMMTGFALTAAGVILYIQAQHKNALLRQLGFGVTMTGIGLYVIGRICVIAQQRRVRKQREQARRSDDPEKEQA